MSSSNGIVFTKLQAIPLDSIPSFTPDEMELFIVKNLKKNGTLVALFGVPDSDHAIRLYCVMSQSSPSRLKVCSCRVKDSWESFTPSAPQAHLFEREIAEIWGIKPVGHPWLKPVRFHKVSQGRKDAWDRADEPILPSVTDFYRVEGQEVHEVAVGPVHAGIIEPGHFRFQCHGENVFHLEISLGYQYRGIEKKLIGGPNSRTLHYMETLAGDTTIGHGVAYTSLCEALCDTAVDPVAESIRAVALELERLANHTGDLGALAGDVGYLPTQSFCGRLRGDFLNMTALLCGNRFGHSLLKPGGVRFYPSLTTIAELLKRLEQTESDVRNAIELLWDTPTVLARFKETGKVSFETATQLGLVGPAARASGVMRDVRSDFPSGYYRTKSIPPASHRGGDVFARAWVRWLEIQHSITFVREILRDFHSFSTSASAKGVSPISSLPANSFIVSLVEGWRGQICHVGLTDIQGKFSAYKVIDPSFRNWSGLAMALRGNQISDFPLCNKSFNLSYCGYDL